jgi:hypothetical protein
VVVRYLAILDKWLAIQRICPQFIFLSSALSSPGSNVAILDKCLQSVIYGKLKEPTIMKPGMQEKSFKAIDVAN